jgi:hypothetical protein
MISMYDDRERRVTLLATASELRALADKFDSSYATAFNGLLLPVTTATKDATLALAGEGWLSEANSNRVNTLEIKLWNPNEND